MSVCGDSSERASGEGNGLKGKTAAHTRALHSHSGRPAAHSLRKIVPRSKGPFDFFVFATDPENAARRLRRPAAGRRRRPPQRSVAQTHPTIFSTAPSCNLDTLSG